MFSNCRRFERRCRAGSAAASEVGGECTEGADGEPTSECFRVSLRVAGKTKDSCGQWSGVEWSGIYPASGSLGFILQGFTDPIG